MQLDEFNALDAAEASLVVSVWAAVPGWVDAIVAARPYASIEALRSYAGDLAGVWSRADLDAAIAHHPRIGEKPSGTGAEADASRKEQSAMASAADEVAAAISAGNWTYEERFGRVFLIRAAGRSPQEMLAELHRRLGNDDDTEAREATAQLAEIALLRLDSTIVADQVEPEEAE
ncbi:2-oxo-4-hydroxy-4-carboxy-5-ureidoimidazoline decarboxylase [Microbacterium binotii]|uniref:2-oxo-4-hydroxy-4-carboxy-5-ureidoimidazoline decarboxylase n=1 Tax=Microbacterium binotii TaxID=462710 RepID=A0ABN3P6B2_9MICO